MELFGHTPRGQPVHRLTLQQGGGPRVQVLTLGGIVTAIEVPDRDGARANVVLALPTVEDYLTRSPHFGAITGRYAGRIARARFTLDGVTHTLTANDGPHALHGGPGGFDHVVWSVVELEAGRVALEYLSPDGEAGFPGALRTWVTYTADAESMRIEYRAETDGATVLNLTNHSYFNLEGEGTGDVMGHVLRLGAARVLAQDGAGIPTGAIDAVAGTPLDFREPQRIGDRIRDRSLLAARGYDHTFVLDAAGAPRVPAAGAAEMPAAGAAEVHAPESGRTLVVTTDQPGVQLYTANKLNGTLVGVGGRAYRQGDGLCLETQHFPDGPNQPGFPSTVLRPGQVFTSWTRYRFGTAPRGAGFPLSLGGG